MVHWRMMSMLAISLLGCASEGAIEDGATELSLQLVDAAVVKATGDAGAGGVKTSVGMACVTDGDCAAPAAKCQTAVSVPFAGLTIKYPGGYCTSQCKADSVCGAGAGCPNAAVAALLPALSSCLKQCEVAADCRDGYSCAEVPALALPGLAGPASAADAGPKQKHCLPPLPI